MQGRLTPSGQIRCGLRLAHAFDSEPLPKLPNFNAPDVSDKPDAITEPAAFDGESDHGHPAQIPLRAPAGWSRTTSARSRRSSASPCRTASRRRRTPARDRLERSLDPAIGGKTSPSSAGARLPRLRWRRHAARRRPRVSAARRGPDSRMGADPVGPGARQGAKSGSGTTGPTAATRHGSSSGCSPTPAPGLADDPHLTRCSSTPPTTATSTAARDARPGHPSGPNGQRPGTRIDSS
jgi:hypothetical protein